jgi:hypothetical protein
VPTPSAVAASPGAANQSVGPLAVGLGVGFGLFLPLILIAGAATWYVRVRRPAMIAAKKLEDEEDAKRFEDAPSTFDPMTDDEQTV